MYVYIKYKSGTILLVSMLSLSLYFVFINGFVAAQNQSNTFQQSLSLSMKQQGENNTRNSVSEFSNGLNQTYIDKYSIDSFRDIRQQYLSVWNNTEFQSYFDTFIEPGSDKGYGIYQIHQSNVYEPGDNIVLYLEPIGFSHKQVFDEQGDTLYQINLTSVITVSDLQGNELGKVENINTGIINSHNKITEMFLVLTLGQDPPFPEGEYNIKYIVYDGATGKSFELTKPVRISQIVTAGIG